MKSLVLLFLTVWLAIVPWTPGAQALCLQEGETAPDFTLEDIGGNPVRLSDYRGKVVFLAFWASWCPRCMEELAFLQGLYTGLADEMVVLAINQETQTLSATHHQSARVAVKCDLCAGYDDYACVTACPVGAAFRIDPVQAFNRDDLLIGLEMKQSA